MTNTSDNRRFRRIPFDAKVRIIDANRSWEGNLLDLSLKGALITQPSGWSPERDTSYRLDIFLSDNEVITMQGTVMHVQNNRIGFRCDFIDLDSVTHLRRLVELNTGDADLLERELSALSGG